MKFQSAIAPINCWLCSCITNGNLILTLIIIVENWRTVTQCLGYAYLVNRTIWWTIHYLKMIAL